MGFGHCGSFKEMFLSLVAAPSVGGPLPTECVDRDERGIRSRSAEVPSWSRPREVRSEVGKRGPRSRSSVGS